MNGFRNVNILFSEAAFCRSTLLCIAFVYLHILCGFLTAENKYECIASKMPILSIRYKIFFRVITSNVTRTSAKVPVEQCDLPLKINISLNGCE